MLIAVVVIELFTFPEEFPSVLNTVAVLPAFADELGPHVPGLFNKIPLLMTTQYGCFVDSSYIVIPSGFALVPIAMPVRVPDRFQHYQ